MATGTATAAVDLRRASLADVRGLDLRSPGRDLWADEAALWDRFEASWAGLDEAAWHLAGAAPSDAGGPDWSLGEHVGHVADWQGLAIDYVTVARETGRWPTDDDFDGGDFDRFNERRRAPWTAMPAASIVARLQEHRRRLLDTVRRLSDAEIRDDASWGWVYMTLHGHYLDHLAVLEPWADGLRVRQADGDPCVEDPRAADHEGFAAQDAEIAALFDALVRRVPLDAWESGHVTPGWTLSDHVGHLADWAAEGVRAIEVYRRRGHWLADPDEGIDRWNERHVAAARGEPPEATLARYDAARADLRAAVAGLSGDELRSPDGWSWAYDCLHGHDRKHLAMLGPWCVSLAWPRD
jgi:hypothetical protein